MPFNCPKCHKIFSSQRDLETHMNRKTPCISDEPIGKHHYTCEFCYNIFSCSRNLERHYSRCIVRNDHTLLIEHHEKSKQLLTEKDEIIKKLEIKIKELESKNLEKLDQDESKKIKVIKDTTVRYEKKNIKKRNDFIYVIKLREFVNTGENIYKIGRTKQGHNKRIFQYPKNSIVFNIIKVPDSIKYEREIMKVFKEKFIHRRDIGREYFEANIASIRREMNRIVKRLDESY